MFYIMRYFVDITLEDLELVDALELVELERRALIGWYDVEIES